MNDTPLPQFPRWLRGIDRRLGNIPLILWIAIRQFVTNRAIEASASIAFFFLFSLFPLLIFLVVIGSFFLQEAAVKQEIMTGLTNVFPTAADFIQQNIEVVIAQRRPAGITAIIGLLWSGTSAFNVLARNINRAWHSAPPRGILQSRLVALIMVSVLVALLFVSLFFSTAVTLLPLAGDLINGLGTHNPVLDILRNTVFPTLLTLLMFGSLYRWIPRADVRWRDALWGGVVATLGWRLAIVGFGWYLTSGLSNFQVIYGSLGTVVALLLWVYISSLITLFGAHLCAAVAHRRHHWVD